MRPSGKSTATIALSLAFELKIGTTLTPAWRMFAHSGFLILFFFSLLLLLGGIYKYSYVERLQKDQGRVSRFMAAIYYSL